MNLRTALVTTVLFASLAAPATHAANYRSDPKSSLLSFSSSYQGEAFTGHFGHFDAHIAFDPANLASSKLDVTISLDSADTQSSERDEMLKGADFFMPWQNSAASVAIATPPMAC